MNPISFSCTDCHRDSFEKSLSFDFEIFIKMRCDGFAKGIVRVVGIRIRQSGDSKTHIVVVFFLGTEK